MSEYFFTGYHTCSRMTHIPVMPAKPHPQCQPREKGWLGSWGRLWTTASFLLESQLQESSIWSALTIEGTLVEFDKEH